VYALIESQRDGWTDPRVITPSVIGIAALAGFVSSQHRNRRPMLPLPLFTLRNYAAGNLVTTLVYGALTLGSLAIALYTQEIGGYSATAAGLATLPIPALSFVFARHVGRIAARVGPRAFLIAGPAFGADRAAADPPEVQWISRNHRPRPRDDRAGDRAGRDYHTAEVGDAGLGADRTQRPGVCDQQRRLAFGRADVDRVHGPDQRWPSERHRFRPHVRGERRTIRPVRVVRRAVDNQSPCRVRTCVPCDIAALCRDRPGVQPALASSPSSATESSRPQ
jgi:hypothetical protein